MKKLYVMISMLMIFSTITACTMTGQTISDRQELVVGYAGPLSGEAGVWGQSMKKGFDFGIAQIDDPRIKIIYEDTKCDAKVGLGVFQKLIELDNAQIVTGTACSSVAHAAAPLVEENKVLYIASGATQPDVPALGEHIFRLWVSDDYEARAVAREAHAQGLDKVAVTFTNDNPAGVSLKDAFVDESKSLGSSVVAIESYSSTEKDFRPVLTKVLAEKPDAIYIMAAGEQIASVINQARALGFEGTIFAYAPSLLAEGVSEKISDHSKIVYAAPQDVKTTSFWSEYQEQTGEEADMLVALGYDSAMMVKEAIDACGEDTDCMSEFFITRSDISTSRGVMSFDGNGDLKSVPFEVSNFE